MPSQSAVRRRSHRSLRGWIGRLDEYTLWAFNPQPPYSSRRSPQARQR